MIVVYATAPNGAKSRKVFWSDAEAVVYVQQITKEGYTWHDGYGNGNAKAVA